MTAANPHWSCDGCAYRSGDGRCHLNPPQLGPDGEWGRPPAGIAIGGCSHWVEDEGGGVDDGPPVPLDKLRNELLDYEVQQLRDANERLLREHAAISTRCQQAEADRDGWRKRAEDAGHWIETARRPIEDAKRQAASMLAAGWNSRLLLGVDRIPNPPPLPPIDPVD